MFIIIRKRLIAIIIVFFLIIGTIVCNAAMPAFSQRKGTPLPIVMYHSIIDDTNKAGKYVITPEQFERDLDYLMENGYTTVCSDELIEYVRKGVPLPKKAIMITFDDGYYNNYLYAYPALKERNMKAVILPIGKYTEYYSETEEISQYYSHVTWVQLKEMFESGVFEIGNHTWDMHSNNGNRKGCCIMAQESVGKYYTAIDNDIWKLQNMLLQKIGSVPVIFAYPFGCMCREAENKLTDMGFKITLSCMEKINNITRDDESLLLLGRFNRAWGKDSAQFFDHILKQNDK